MSSHPLIVASGALALLLAGCAGNPAQAPGQGAGSEARVQHLVSEDDAVRVDELRVRGQTQRLTVSPKHGAAPAYEIQPAAGGSDPSKSRDGAGQRLWNVLSF